MSECVDLRTTFAGCFEFTEDPSFPPNSRTAEVSSVRG
jgi:hypothetical protein